MPVLYKPFQSVLEDKNKKKLFHPRVIYTATVSTAQLAKERAAYSSLSTGDVKNTLDKLVTVSAQHLLSLIHICPAGGLSKICVLANRSVSDVV